MTARAFKHLIEPYITYRLIRGIGTEFNNILRFDERDAVANTNEFEYALVNRSTRGEPAGCHPAARQAPAPRRFAGDAARRGGACGRADGRGKKSKKSRHLMIRARRKTASGAGKALKSPPGGPARPQAPGPRRPRAAAGQSTGESANPNAKEKRLALDRGNHRDGTRPAKPARSAMMRRMTAIGAM